MAFAGAHHRLAHFGHNRTDISKVEVDQARHDHQVSDRAHALLQHFVGQMEGFLEGRFRLGHQEQVLVGDDDQGIDVLLQFLDPGFGRAHPAGAFEQERLGHHANGQDTLFTGGLGHNRSRAGAGAAAHAGSDEAHVCAIQRAVDLSQGFLGRSLAHFGARTGTQTLGDIGTQLDPVLRDRIVERLRIRIGNNEINAFDPSGDHVGNGVTARTAHPDHSDPGTQLFDGWRSDIDAHGALLSGKRIQILNCGFTAPQKPKFPTHRAALSTVALRLCGDYRGIRNIRARRGIPGQQVPAYQTG